ncbi:MAG: hypothetical protein KDA16_00065 [Phycisphaerales bacterium]|nr:hypothetical protein [Phycisphaerales bacterium]
MKARPKIERPEPDPVPTEPAEDDGGDVVGIRCPNCASRLCPVMWTRKTTKGRIRRARQCVHCRRRFGTTEIATGAQT